MRNLLEDKVAIVTGGARGLGAAIAARFAAENARVMVADIDYAEAQRTAEHLGTSAIAQPLDVADEASFTEAVRSIVSRWSRLDILVNNAAVAVPTTPVQTTTLAEFDTLIDVNLRGVWLGCKIAYTDLKSSQGCVLNISSMAGVTGQQKHAVYAATKGAVNAMTKCMAVDWGPDRIRVNALCPTGIWTDALVEWRANQSHPEHVDEYLNRLHALGYCPEPEEIAAAAAFLCSDEAKFMTGAIVPVSGGSECGYRL